MRTTTLTLLLTLGLTACGGGGTDPAQAGRDALTDGDHTGALAHFDEALEGKTSGVSVTSNSLGDSQVSNCVARVLRRMRFRKPEGGICVVQWPFVFNSGG